MEQHMPDYHPLVLMVVCQMWTFGLMYPGSYLRQKEDVMVLVPVCCSYCQSDHIIQEGKTLTGKHLTHYLLSILSQDHYRQVWHQQL